MADINGDNWSTTDLESKVEIPDEDRPPKKHKAGEAPKSKYEETEEQTKMRFLVELEFVQCLANPHYLNCNGIN